MIRHCLSIQGKAGSLWILASLALSTFLLLRVMAAQEGQVLAFSSPNSPLQASTPTVALQSPLDAPHLLPVVVNQTGPSEEPASVGYRWQRPVGIGIAVLGFALVVGGLVYLMRK